MPNVYVGQYADIRHSAVYSSIDEAVKEVQRVIQAGLMIAFVNLPDSDRYWIAGTVGKNSNPKFNLIFTNKPDAVAHLESVKQRGWPSSEVFMKELKIIQQGPKTPDIKTEEHLRVERKYDLLKRALERGLPITNDEGSMEILLIEDDPNKTELIFNRAEYAVFKLDGWTQSDPVSIYDMHRRLRKLLNEMARVNVDEQPNKWRRLQNTCAQLAVDPYFGEEKIDTEDDANVDA